MHKMKVNFSENSIYCLKDSKNRNNYQNIEPSFFTMKPIKIFCNCLPSKKQLTVV